MANTLNPKELLPQVKAVILHKTSIQVIFADNRSLKLFPFTENGVWTKIEWSCVENPNYRTLAIFEELIHAEDNLQFTITAIGIRENITQYLYFSYLWAAFIKLEDMLQSGNEFQKRMIKDFVTSLNISKYLFMALGLLPTKVETV